MPKALARSALECYLAPLRKAEGLSRPSRGWIKAMREAFGMTTAQLAERIGVSQPRVTFIEKAEADDSITLRTLRQMAEGMGCKLVYALVPEKPLEDMLYARAMEVAHEALLSTNPKHENEPLDPRALKKERERLIEDLMRGDPRRLWDKLK